jgi:hypothetical protein
MGHISQRIHTRVWVQNYEKLKWRKCVPPSHQILAVPIQENPPQNSRNQNFQLESNLESKNKVQERDLWGPKILGPGL